MKFDINKFKEYINTYSPEEHGLGKDNTIIKDILYGIGFSMGEEFLYNQGYIKFLKEHVSPIMEKQFNNKIKNKEKILLRIQNYNKEIELLTSEELGYTNNTLKKERIVQLINELKWTLEM